MHIDDVYELQVAPWGSKGSLRETTEELLRGWHHLILMPHHRSRDWSTEMCVCWSWLFALLLPQWPVLPPISCLKLFLSSRIPLLWLSGQTFTSCSKSGRGLQRSKEKFPSENLSGFSGKKKSCYGCCGSVLSPVWTDELHFWEWSCPVRTLGVDKKYKINTKNITQDHYEVVLKKWGLLVTFLCVNYWAPWQTMLTCRYMWVRDNTQGSQKNV